MSHLRTTGCHRSMVSHNFTCTLAAQHKRAHPALTPASKASTRVSIYLPWRDGRLSWNITSQLWTVGRNLVWSTRLWVECRACRLSCCHLHIENVHCRRSVKVLWVNDKKDDQTTLQLHRSTSHQTLIVKLQWSFKAYIERCAGTFTQHKQVHDNSERQVWGSVLPADWRVWGVISCLRGSSVEPGE